MAESTFPITGAQVEKDPSVLIQAYLKDFLDLIVRRKWLIIFFILLGISVGVGLAWMKKDVYRSSTVILVEQQKIHENYVPSVVGGSAAERVSTITQQVLSRTNLQKVIDEFHLFPDVINIQGYEPVIDGLRKNVKIETKGRGNQLEAFTISFAHHDPMMAMKVTSKLASQYIDENIKIREQFIEGATEFLEQELTAAKHVLDEKERLLSEYKLKYAGELPGQLETNLRTLDRLQEEKIQLQESINGLNVRMELLQKSIRDYEAMAGTLMEFSQSSFQGGGASVGGNPVAMRVVELKRELAKMSGEYTDAYPDIVSLKTQIKNLEKELSQHQENIDSIDDGQAGNEIARIDAPVFDPYLAELMNSRDELKAQIVGLRAQLTRVSKEMQNLEQSIARTPTREQEMLVLERDYGNMRESYQHLHEKRLNAHISENLDKRQKGERFRILDPANLPSKPEGLPRELLALGGLGGGVGLGFGLAFLLDLLSPTFRRSEDVEVSLGFPMLATIPSFQMAYGKSMKMLPGMADSSVGGTGKQNSNGFTNYFDAEMVGKSKSMFYRESSKVPAFPPQLNLVSKWRPQSVVAEQFRVAATRLDLLGDRPMGNVVLLSSAMKGEGKTSSAVNLAYTLARDLDEPTLVIDCDYKCPNIHNVFTLRPEPGLADYLAGEASLESCFQQISDLPLWGISVGDVTSYPVSLSKLQNVSSLIESVRSRYRFIILDGPPILPLADINILSGLADIVLMVVRSGTTPKDVVQKAVEMLHSSSPTRLILTDAWSQGAPYYVRHGYSTPYSLTSSG
jgi:polysaccharide chain length determinant protein (PEP-CTERM system associated)